MTRALCLGLVLLAAAGCLPLARVAWSPNGTYALISGGDGLYLCDGDGKLSPRVAEDVTAVAWMPDSKQFVASCATTLKTWNELAPHLSKDRLESVQAAAEEYRKQILAYKGDWNDFEFKAEFTDTLAALVCLRDQHAKELAPVVGERWKDLDEVRHRVFALRLFDVEGGKVKPSKVLLESLEPIAEIRPSPDGKALAYAAPPFPPVGYDPVFSLFVFPLEVPDNPSKVADRVSIFFDWTPDGRSVVYARAEFPDPTFRDRRIPFRCKEGPVLYGRNYIRDPERQPPHREGEIIKAAVMEDGRLPDKIKQDSLARVLFYDSLPVRCLKDGRILFASRESHRPALAGEDERMAIYCLGPNGIEPVFSAEVLEQAHSDLAFFQVSPDESQLVVMGGDRMTVLHMKANRVIVEERQNVNESFGGITRETIPVWRSERELCFVVAKGSKLGSPDADELVLWSPAGSRILSKDWPEAVRSDWLPRARPEAKPAQPAALPAAK
jgi:hypothetical protein